VLRRTDVSATQDLDEIEFPDRFESSLAEREDPLDGRVIDRPD
jgi:hypothetical protein